ncbi:MAG: leucine-rich repeat domain-containing protein [Eubacteriales bacterium]
MRKNKKTFVCAVILLLSAPLTLTSCSAPGASEEETGESETEAVFTPAVDEGEDSALYKRYEEYKENASLAFKNNSPLSGENFEYETVDGGVRITKYVGEDSIIVVPDSIEGLPVCEIGESAFSGGVIRAIYIPDSVESIAQGAIDGCEGLSTLRLPFVGDGEENLYIGYIFGADEPAENAISLPPSLDMVIIGEGCTAVADRAFYRAKTLSAVVFEGEIDYLGTLSFYECADLVYITLEKAVGEIGEYSFAYCPSLYCADVSNAKNVGAGAFYMCSKLHTFSVTFGENDFLGRYFGAESFEYNLEFVPDSLRHVKVGEGCEKIPDKAFASCEYITSVSLPDTLRTVGIRAFYGCRSLGEITFPDSLKVIDDDAFFGCDNLKTVEFGLSLESIGMQAFYGCISLEKADVGEGVKVGNGAFGNCPKLK